jgi:hypothetical protein
MVYSAVQGDDISSRDTAPLQEAWHTAVEPPNDRTLSLQADQPDTAEETPC